MIWLTWRQHRMEILILIGLFAVLSVVLFVTGLQIHHVYDVSSMAHCLYTYAFPGDCGRAYDTFLPMTGRAHDLMMWLNLLPMLYGIILGAPLLAREYEQGTYKFAWTQGVSRSRWLFAKLGVLLLVLLVFSGALTVIMTWWNQPYDAVLGRFNLVSWDTEGLMPVAFAVFAFALGAAAGGLFRRVVPAVAAVFAYIPLWLTADNWLRAVLPPPLSVRYSLDQVPTLSRQDWRIAEGVVDHFGHPVYGGVPACPPATPCPAAQGLEGYLIYQPASRFWEIQGIEAAMLLGVALLLLWFVLWRVRHRAI